MCCLSRLPGRIGWVWIAPGLLLLISLAVPATRELHLLMLRMYTHIPCRETSVHGQPPGCVVYVVPTVEFTRETEDRLLKESGQSIDTFLLAHAVSSNRLSAPPASLHAGHPIQSWLALRVSSVAHWNAMISRRQSATQPSPYDVPLPTISLEEILKTIRLAQSTQPENGLLWIAEALVRLDLGQEQAVDAALLAASSKPAWDDQSPKAFKYLRDLFIKHGLPAFDASVFANTAISENGERVSFVLTREVLEPMAQAVKENDNKRLAEIMSRAILLLEGVSPHVGTSANPFPTSPDMMVAMAARMGRTLPDERALYQLRTLAKEEILYQYLAQYTDSDRAWRLRALGALGEATLQGKYESTRETRDHWFDQALLSGMASSRAVLIFGLCLAATLAEIPFVLAGKAGHQQLLPRSRSFCFATALVFAVMVGLAFNAIHLVCQPVGLRVIEHEPSLTPSQENLVAAATACLCILLVRFVLSNWVWVYRIGLAMLWCLWLVAIAHAAWLREDVIADLAKLHGA